MVMWVEVAVGSYPCSDGFSSGPRVFLHSQKLTFLNFNSTRVENDAAFSLNILIYLF